MRPHRLTVRAFGPFAHEQVVDFDALRDDGLFLIHGTTGSGKTFLLDALSFALYGEVSGDRSVTSLRSDHADPAAEPRVTLTFTTQGERWLIERVPPHRRLGIRAGSLVDKPARAVLSRWVDDPRGDRWEPEATGVKEVGSRVLDLLGLTARQFRQVVVLPQGRFHEVLLASSDAREELLKTLFDSVLYEHVALHLDRRAREATAALDTAEHDLAHLRRQAVERAAEITLDAPGTRATAAAPTGDGIDDQAGLDRLAARLAAHAARAEAGADHAAVDAATAARRLAEGTAVLERMRHRDDLQAALAQLDAAADAMAAARDRLARHDRADAIAPLLDEATEAERAVAAARAGAAGRHAGLRDLVRAARAPVPAEVAEVAEVVASRRAPGPAGTDARHGPVVTDPADLQLEPGDPSDDDLRRAHDALTVRRAQLRELVDLDRRSRALEAEAAAAAARADELAHGVERARFELAGLASTERDLRARLRRADDAAAQLDGLEAAAQALAARARAAGLVEQAAGAHERALDAHARADAELARCRERVDQLRAAHLDGIASVLAAHLVEGDPCLVCGSDVHPHPAEAAPGAVGADDVARAEAQLDAARAAERAAAAEVHRALATLAGHRRDAGTAAADPDTAIAAAQEAIAAVADAAEVAATGGEVLEQLSTLDARRGELAALVDRDAPLAAAARRDAEALRAEAEVGARRRRDLAGDGADLDGALAEVDRLLDAIAALRDARSGAARAADELDRARHRLAAALDRSPFTTAGEASTARLDPGDRARLLRAVHEHDERRATVTAQLRSPALADLPPTAPDLDQLRAAAEVAERAARDAHDQRARAAAASAAVAELAERHRALTAQVAEQRAQAELITAVADQCMGRVGDRISLQRWVLAGYLEEICELATERLLAMSSHRYSLRVHREAAGRGARSGLDLRVFDAHTGEDRAVQTLSGGEVFQASLALALAVAESVQRHAGGVRLETLFVDEGFGTLDPVSLELALDELDALRAGGRTVGIISHVAALRERIRSGIEVTASPQGSAVRVGAVAAA